MQYISTAERIGMEKGMEQGMEKGMEKGMEQGMEKGMLLGSIQTALEIKFGAKGLSIYSKIKRIRNRERLEKILEIAKTAESPNAILNVFSTKDRASYL